MQTWQQATPSYETLHKYADLIRQYILLNAGNISQFFEKADIDGDNYLKDTELKNAFGHLGMNLSDAETSAMVKLFDLNGDGKISYSELCKYFADVNSAKAITDETHWAYYIFERIRRQCNSTK
jgi:Ca2+-binding EF-hand superfamily protein